jgi:hypothetical protein
MANRECHQERLAELNQRLAAALNAMDYEVALACQMVIDDLRLQRVTRQPSRKHFYLMQRTAASPLPIITRHSLGLAEPLRALLRTTSETATADILQNRGERR